MDKKLIPALALLALLGGCHKTVVEHPVAPAPTEPHSVCPEADTIDTETIDMETVWEDWFEEEEEPTICSDGKAYCYSADSRPIAQPDVPDGWSCRFVRKLPASHVIPNTYEFYKNYNFFNDSAYIRQVKTKVEWSFQKAWVCEEDECACDDKWCPENGICIDGECYCNDAPYQGGDCELWKGDDEDEDEEINRDEVYYTSCKDKKGNPVKDCDALEKGGTLYCGDSPITEKPTEDGRIIQQCIQIDDNQYAIYYHKEENNILFYGLMPPVFEKINSERNKNRKNPAYRCGNETCVDGEICLDNACVGLGTRAKLPNENYVWKEYMPVCVKADGCDCGGTRCAKNEFCIEGECKDSPHYQKLNGELVYYDLTTLKDDMVEDDAVDVVWFDILTHPVSRTCGNAPIPDAPRGYTCDFRLSYGENDRVFWRAEGFRCTAPGGCGK